MESRSCQAPLFESGPCLSPDELFFRSGLRLDPKDCFAFLHQVEFVAGHRLQVGGIGFEQVHFPGLPGK